MAATGRAGSDEVAAASGSIKISNVTQDETVDEYDVRQPAGTHRHDLGVDALGHTARAPLVALQYEVTCYDETPQKRKVKEVARTKLVATIKKKLVDFVAALKVGKAPGPAAPTGAR